LKLRLHCILFEHQPDILVEVKFITRSRFYRVTEIVYEDTEYLWSEFLRVSEDNPLVEGATEQNPVDVGSAGTEETAVGVVDEHTGAR